MRASSLMLPPSVGTIVNARGSPTSCFRPTSRSKWCDPGANKELCGENHQLAGFLPSRQSSTRASSRSSCTRLARGASRRAASQA
eukprot:269799-Heterocapsa_arctica.AAC.1